MIIVGVAVCSGVLVGLGVKVGVAVLVGVGVWVGIAVGVKVGVGMGGPAFSKVTSRATKPSPGCVSPVTRI